MVTLGYLKHPIPPGPPGPGGRGGCVPCGWSLSVNSRQPQPYPRSILPTSGRCQEGEPGSSPGPELLSWRGGEYPAPQHSSRPATPCSHCVGQRMAGPKRKQESSIFFPRLSSLVLQPAPGSQKAGETVWGDKPGQESFPAVRGNEWVCTCPGGSSEEERRAPGVERLPGEETLGSSSIRPQGVFVE